MIKRSRAGQQASRGAGAPAPSPRLRPLAAHVRLACLPAMLLGLHAGAVLAGPEGGRVVAGQGAISRPDAATTLVRQRSQSLAVDWQSFDVDRHETVRFDQPGRNAAALNNIFDSSPSQIFGRIQANGRVFLLNPNGLVFSPTAVVNVNGLVAAGARMGVADFMAGRYRLETVPDTDGIVVNQGTIEAATGGSVALAGKAVRNEGVILASAGRVTLAAGSKMTVDFDGDGLMRFAVDEGVMENAQALDAAVANSGEVLADGGEVLMSARTARDVFDNAINNSGTVRAGRIERQGGVIRLAAAGPGASVLNTGRLEADGTGGPGGTVTIVADGDTVVGGEARVSARGDGGAGGAVRLLGERVGLAGSSTVDAGGAVGGEVLVGGDFQGANPAIANALDTYVGPAVTITADAEGSGDGGRVIIWSDAVTRFLGEVSARGGEAAGDGGFVEVSGAERLAFTGHVDAGAPAGAAGTILLDPDTITIKDTAGDFVDDDDSAEIGDGEIRFDDDNDAGADQDFEITDDAIEALTGNIILQAKNAITVNAALDLAEQTAGEFVVLQAGEGITLAAAITTQGADLFLEADSPFSTGGNAADGSGTLAVNAPLSTNGGAVNLIGDDIDITADIDAGAGAINLTTSRALDPLTFGSNATDELDADTETDHLLTTGTLTLGRAQQAGADGQTFTDLTTGSIEVLRASDLSALNAASIVLVAQDGIDVDAALTTSTATVLNADADAAGGGTLDLAAGTAVTTTGNALAVTADALIFGDAGSDLDAGSAAIRITDSDGSGIGLGATAVGLDVTGAELENNLVTSGGVTFETAGAITVDGISAANSNGKGTITLDAAGAVTFASSASTFDTLVAESDGNVAVDIDLTVDTGDLTLTADAEGDNTGDVDVNAALVTNGGQAILAGENIDNTGGTLTTGSGNAQLNAAAGVTVGEAITSGGGEVTITAGTGTSLAAAIDSAGGNVAFTGGVDLAASQLVDTGAGAGDITFNDAITDSGTATLTLAAGTGSITLAAVTLDDAGGSGLAFTSGAGLTLNGDLAQSSTLDFSNLADGDTVTLGATPLSIAVTGAGNDILTTAENLNGASALTLAAPDQVTLQSAGNSTPLASLEVSTGADTVTTGSIAAIGAITLEAASAINLAGSSYASDDATVTLNGPVNLTGSGDVTLDSDANDDGTDGSISITGALEDPGSDSNLILTADAAGNVTLSAAAGTTDALGSFRVDAANAVALDAITTAGGVIQVGTDANTRTGGTLTLNGNLTSHAGGDAGAIGLFADAIRIEANGGSAGTLSLDTDSAATDAAISLATDAGGGGTLASATANEDGLSVAAGSATPELGAAVLEALDHFVLTAGAATLGDLTVGDGGGNAGVGIDIDTTAGDLTLTGDLAATAENDAGAIALDGVSGNIVLADTGDGTVQLSTDAAGTDSDITIGGVVDGGGGGQALALDAGTADVTIAGPIGTDADPIGALVVDGNDIAFDADVDAAGITARAAQSGGDDDSIAVAAVTLDAQGGSADFAADAINLDPAAVPRSTGGGSHITFRGETAATAINIGDNAASGDPAQLDLAEADLQLVDPDFGEIRIGTPATQSGTITVNESGDGLGGLATDLELLAEAGDVAIDGAIDLSAVAGVGFAVTGAGDSTLLNADIITEGGAIVIADSVLVSGARTLDSGSGGAAATGGLIQITGPIGSDDTTGDTLTLDARGGADGAVDLEGAIGDAGDNVNGAPANDLTGFTVHGGQVDVAVVEVTGGAITVNGANIDLNGARYQTTTSGGIAFGGPVDVAAATVTVQTAGASPVSFSGAVNGTGGQGLEVDTSAGDGAVDFQSGADVNDLASFMVSAGTGEVDLQSVTNIAGALQVTGGDGAPGGTVIDLEGSSYASSGGMVTFTGDVNLASDVTVTSNDQTIQFGPIDGNNQIDLDAGTGQIIINGAVGAATPLAEFDIDAAGNVTLGDVTTQGAAVADTIAITASGTVSLSGDLRTDGASGDTGGIAIDAALSLNANVALDTDGDGNDGAIAFSGTSSVTSLVADNVGIEFATGGNNLDLSTTTLSALDFVNVSSAADVTLGATSTGAGDNNLGNGIEISNTGIVFLNGDLDTTNEAAAGAITFSGGTGIQLNDDIQIITDAGTTDANIAIGIPVGGESGGAAEALTLTAGDGTVDITAAVGGAPGGGTELGLLTASAATVDVNADLNTTGISLAGATLVDVAAVTLDANGGAFTLASDDITIAAGAAIQSTGGSASAVLQGSGVATSIGVGTGAAGTLNLSETELGRVTGDFTEIVAGASGQTGLVTIDDAGDDGTLTLANTGLRIRNDGAGAGGVDQLAGGAIALTNAGSAFTIDGLGATTTLRADIDTTGGAVSINDATVLAADVTVDTTNGVPAGAGIAFALGAGGAGGTVDGDGNGPWDLSLNAGTGGTVAIAGAVGATDSLDVLTVAAADIVDLEGDVRANTIDASNVGTRIDLAQDVDLTALAGDLLADNAVNQILLSGAGGTNVLESDGGSVSLGPVARSGGASLTVTAQENVTLSSVALGGGTLLATVDDNDDGAGTLTLNGAVGAGTTTLSGGGAAGAGDALDVNADVTATGALTIENFGAGVDLAQDVDLSGAGLTANSNLGAGIDLSGDGGTNVIASTGDANSLAIAPVTESGSPDPNLTLASDGDLDLTAAAVDIGTGTFSAVTDANNGGPATILTAGDTINAGGITLGGGTDADDLIDVGQSVTAGSFLTIENAGTVAIAQDVNLTANAGNLSIDNNVVTIDFTGAAGTNRIQAIGGAVSLAALSDTGTPAEVEIVADTGITIASADLANALGLEPDDDNAGAETLTAGMLSAGSLSVEGGSDADEIMNFNGDLATTGGDLVVDNAAQVNLAVDVDLVATAGRIDMNDSVGQIDLAGGGGTNRLAADGDIELATIVDGGAASALDIDVDEDGSGVDTVRVTGDLTAQSIDVSGAGSDDILDLAAGTTLTATGGALDLHVLGSIELSGNGGINTIAANGAVLVDLADVLTTNGAADASLTVSSGGGVNLRDVDLDGAGAGAGDLLVTVDSDDDGAATLTLLTGTLDVGAGSNLGGGGTGTGDTLQGADIANAWQITGTGSGSLNGVAFGEFFNLGGGSTTDTFNITAGSVTGGIDGGTAGPDTLDYTGFGSSITVVLSGLGSLHGFAGTGATTATGGFDNIDAIVEDGGANDSITGFDNQARWEIDGTNRYCVGADCSGDTLGIEGFENLTGGSSADTFLFTGTATVGGDVDGGATGTGDEIDFSGSTLVQRVDTDIGTNNGQSGTIVDEPADPGPPNTDLIGGEFDNVNILTGNGLGALLGPPGDTWWDIDGLNSGTFGDSLAAIADNSFNNFRIIGGIGQDTFTFSGTGEITGNIDGGAGADNILAGSAGGDIFTITNASIPDTDSDGTEVDILFNGNTTSLERIAVIDGADAGDTGNDVFNIDASWDGDLRGTGGADTFTFNGDRTVGGIIDGGTGSDVIDWSAAGAARAVTLTASDADGFDGTEASITGGFSNVGEILGNGAGGDSLVGQNQAATWTFDDAATDPSTYTVAGNTLAHSGFEDLAGGADNDSFEFANAGSHAGTISGGSSAADQGDIIRYLASYTPAVNVVLAGDGSSNGFQGTEPTSITAGYDNINAVQTAVGGDLTAPNQPNNWIIDGVDSFRFDTGTVPFTGFDSLTGGSAADNFFVEDGGRMTGGIDGGAGANTINGSDSGDVWTIASASGGTITTGAGDTVFVNIANINTASPPAGTGGVVGGDGADEFNLNANFGTGAGTGTIAGQGGDDTFNTAGFEATGTTFAGGAGEDTLNGGDVTRNWTISGQDAGTVDNPAQPGVSQFTGMERLNGGSATDTFTFSSVGAAITGIGGIGIDGGAGGANDRVNGSPGGDVIALTGAAQGELQTGGNSTSFQSVEIVSGGAGDDTVELSAAGEGGFANLIGGAGSGDVLVSVDDGGANTWNVTGGANSGSVNGQAFTGFENLTGGTDADTFDLASNLSGNIVLGGGTSDNAVTSTTGAIGGSITSTSAGADTLALNRAVGGAIALGDGDNSITSSAAIGGDVTGGGGNDTFTLNGDVGGDVALGEGTNTLDTGAAIAGSVSAGGGADTVTLNGPVGDAIALGDGDNSITSSAAIGGGVTAGAGNDTFTLNGNVGGDVVLGGGVNVLSTNALIDGNVSAGGGADTVTVNGGRIAGDLTTGGGDDLLDVNGAGAVDGIYNGGAGDDTADFADTGAALTITLGTTVTAVENLIGSGNERLVARNTVNTWTIDSTNAGTLSEQGGETIDFEGVRDVRGGANADTFNAAAGFSGTVEIAGDDVWNYSDGVPLAATVTGAAPASLAAVGAQGADVEIGSVGVDGTPQLVLPDTDGFTGHLILGGTLDPTTLPVDGDTEVAVSADNMSVTENIRTGGALTLLAGSVSFADPVAIAAGGPGGSQLTIVAVGESSAGNIEAGGDITAEGDLLIGAGPTTMIAANEIGNMDNAVLNLDNAEFQVVFGEAAEEPTFSPSSTANGIEPTDATVAFVSGLAGTGFSAFQNVNVTFAASFFNVGAQLTQLSELAFIDLSVFEEELELIGQRGTGQLTPPEQCEDADICGPSIGKEEAKELVAQVEARIGELERRQAAGAEDPEEVAELLAGFEQELQRLQETVAWWETYEEITQAAFGPGAGEAPGDFEDFEDFDDFEDFEEFDDLDEGGGQAPQGGLQDPERLERMPEAAAVRAAGLMPLAASEHQWFLTGEYRSPLRWSGDLALPPAWRRY